MLPGEFLEVAPGLPRGNSIGRINRFLAFVSDGMPLPAHQCWPAKSDSPEPPALQSLTTRLRKRHARENAMSEFFLWINEQAQGPFAIQQLRGMLTNSEIDANTLWSRDGDQEWKPLSELAMPPEISRKPSIHPALLSRRIIITTGNDIGGFKIESYLGVVRGIVVRSPNVMQGMFGGLKQIVGGNIESYAQVCEEARNQAYDRMVKQARELDADAIIAFRYDATEFTPGATEVLAYGTAVKLGEI
jgi:uncharacterized protein YbjQ (UPF0145 family)